MEGDLPLSSTVTVWDVKVAVRSALADRSLASLNDILYGEKKVGPTIREEHRLTTGAMHALRQGLVVVDENGFMRCPPGSANAMQFTDHMGANCATPAAAPGRAVRLSLEKLGGRLRDANVPLVSEADVRANRLGAAASKPNPVRLHSGLSETEHAMRALSGHSSLDVANFNHDQKKQMLGYLQKAPGFGWVNPDDPSHFDKAVKQLSDNLLRLMNRTTPEERATNRRWYDVAHEFSNNLAGELNVPDHLVSAVVAAMSPQKDWDQNTAMAEHALRLLSDKNYVVDDAVAKRALVYSMDQWRQRSKMSKTVVKNAQKDVADAKEKLAAARKANNGRRIAEWELKLAARGEKLNAAKAALAADARPTLEDIKNKHMADLPDAEAASVIRAHGELVGGTYLHQPLAKLSKTDVKNGKSPHRLLAYKTTFLDGKDPGAHTVEGDPGHAVAATSFPVYNGVVRMFRSGGDMSVIDAQLGSGSKVRSFYNNIQFPNDTLHKDTTIDTHAIAALLATPISAKHNVTDLAFSNVDSFGTGQAYVMFRAAMLQTAERWKTMTGEDLLPREVQSITWEKMRALIEPHQKNAVVDRVAQVHRLGAAGDKRFKGKAGHDAVMRLVEAGATDLEALNKGRAKKDKVTRAQLVESVVRELGLPAMTGADVLPKAVKKTKPTG